MDKLVLLAFAAALLAHVALPAALCLALMKRPPKSRSDAVASCVAVALVVALVSLIGGWSIVGLYVRWMHVVLAAAAVASRLRSRAPGAVARPSSRAWARGWVVTTVLAAGALTAAIAGRRTPTGPTIALTLPLRGGDTAVTQGGGSALVNAHAAVGAQRYALDLVMLNSFGFRARSPIPTELTDFYVFHQAVFAPCDGEVLIAVDGRPDNSPFRRDPEFPAGNHVALLCGNVTVLLAHLSAGSVRVRRGDRVTIHTQLGLVGNSGNTTEPHLHIHAVRGRITDDEVLRRSAQPVAMLLNARFLVRNDVVAPSDG